MVFHALTFARSCVRCWKPKPKAAVFNTSQGTWRMLMYWKNIFDRYYCIKTENICYISRYFLPYFVSPFHWCLANEISTYYAPCRAGRYTSRNGSKSVAPVRSYWKKKVREKSRECHNHKPQPFPHPKRKRKPTNLNKHIPNKRTKSTKFSSLFPKRGNRNTKRTEKHKNKMTHGKTYNESLRRINHKATKSKTNIGTTALERTVEETTGGFKALLQLANFTLGPDATLNTEIHKNSVRIKAPNSVNASKRKHKNQINHYNKQGRVLMANSTLYQS